MRLALAASVIGSAAMAEPALYGSVAADLNGDELTDLAVLVGESDLSLAIFGQEEEYGPMFVLGEAPALAWLGSLNEPPRMEATPGGSLRVTSSNWGIGRNKWEMTLTIAYRRDAFRIAGLTYQEVDTLDLAAGFSCDINLLSGRGNVMGAGENAREQEIRVEMDAPSIEEWDHAMITEICPGPDP